MFVEHSIEVDVGLATVEKSLDAVRGNLAEWADVAYRNGEDLRAKVGSGPLAKEVDLVIGIAEIHSFGLVYPIHWTATEAHLLFPVLRADLVLTKHGVNKTRLTLRGTYEPPLGVMGRIADRAGLGRIAHSTIKSWLERLADEITASANARPAE